MTYEEAIKILNGDFSEAELKEGESHSDLFQQAFRMAIEALEKQTPKKIVPFEKNTLLEACPSCGCIKSIWGEKYCSRCGQALIWEEVNK